MINFYHDEIINDYYMKIIKTLNLRGNKINKTIFNKFL